MRFLLYLLCLFIFSCGGGGDDSTINTNIQGIWIAKSVSVNLNPEGGSPCNPSWSSSYSYSNIESIRGIHLNQNNTYWKNLIRYEYDENAEENSPIALCECEYPFLCEEEGVYIYENNTLTLCNEYNDFCTEILVHIDPNGNEIFLSLSSGDNTSPNQRDCDDSYLFHCDYWDSSIYLERYQD